MKGGGKTGIERPCRVFGRGGRGGPPREGHTERRRRRHADESQKGRGIGSKLSQVVKMVGVQARTGSPINIGSL